ncbi:MAG: HAD family hydrolase [Chloroflexota bacterium]|nr:HAD family hydrolase [Chloroflexota bacterium]
MPQHLLIDADDTLWENNIYFERATEEFIDFLNHSALAPYEVCAVLDEVEMTQGYGSASFTRSLEATYRRLVERDIRDEDLEQVRRFGVQITEHPMQLMEGVQETLEYLAPRHALIMLTKGNEEEQKLKVENSGLKLYFRDIIVVAEKDVATYIGLVEELLLDHGHTWMVGNSPKSDINPALAVGLNAVFIPHMHTWGLEKQDIRHEGSGRLLVLDTFAELCEHF